MLRLGAGEPIWWFMGSKSCGRECNKSHTHKRVQPSSLVCIRLYSRSCWQYKQQYKEEGIQSINRQIDSCHTSSTSLDQLNEPYNERNKQISHFEQYALSLSLSIQLHCPLLHWWHRKGSNELLARNSFRNRRHRLLCNPVCGQAGE